jgi:hypothetical protein
VHRYRDKSTVRHYSTSATGVIYSATLQCLILSIHFRSNGLQRMLRHCSPVTCPQHVTRSQSVSDVLSHLAPCRGGGPLVSATDLRASPRVPAIQDPRCPVAHQLQLPLASFPCRSVEQFQYRIDAALALVAVHLDSVLVSPLDQTSTRYGMLCCPAATDRRAILPA